jgi:hypothetical protein
VDPKNNFAITGMPDPKIGQITTPNTTRIPTMKHTKSRMQASGMHPAHRPVTTLAYPLAHGFPSSSSCRYPWCRHLIYDNGSEFKLHFEYPYESHGITRKPTTVKNPGANRILERVHQVLGQMLRTTELADSVTPNDIDVFLDNAAWAICSTYHTVLKASPGAAIFGRDMLFDILFVADWRKIGEWRQY